MVDAVIHEASHQLKNREARDYLSLRCSFIYFSNVAENSVTFSFKVESFRRFLK